MGGPGGGLAGVGGPGGGGLAGGGGQAGSTDKLKFRRGVCISI